MNTEEEKIQKALGTMHEYEIGGVGVFDMEWATLYGGIFCCASSEEEALHLILKKYSNLYKVVRDHAAYLAVRKKGDDYYKNWYICNIAGELHRNNGGAYV